MSFAEAVKILFIVYGSLGLYSILKKRITSLFYVSTKTLSSGYRTAYIVEQMDEIECSLEDFPIEFTLTDRIKISCLSYYYTSIEDSDYWLDPRSRSYYRVSEVTGLLDYVRKIWFLTLVGVLFYTSCIVASYTEYSKIIYLFTIYMWMFIQLSHIALKVQKFGRRLMWKRIRKLNMCYSEIMERASFGVFSIYNNITFRKNLFIFLTLLSLLHNINLRIK